MKNQNKNNEHRRRSDRFTAGLNVSMTVQFLLMTAFAGMMTIPTVAAADTCRDDSAGAGWEYTDCDFSCSAGETVAVLTSQEDADYVYGKATCDDAFVDCSSNIGKCSSRSTSTASQYSSQGECTGRAYSSFRTDAHLLCMSGDGDSEAVMEVLDMLMELPGGLDVPPVPSCSTLMQSASEGGYSSGAYMQFSTEKGGDSWGLVWTQSRCTIQQPDCTEDTSGFRLLHLTRSCSL